jgi:hypothetical protein
MEEKRYLNEAFKKVAEFINISEEQLELILDMMSQNPYLIFRATSISLERIPRLKDLNRLKQILKVALE